MCLLEIFGLGEVIKPSGRYRALLAPDEWRCRVFKRTRGFSLGPPMKVIELKDAAGNNLLGRVVLVFSFGGNAPSGEAHPLPEIPSSPTDGGG